MDSLKSKRSKKIFFCLDHKIYVIPTFIIFVFVTKLSTKICSGRKLQHRITGGRNFNNAARVEIRISRSVLIFCMT